MSQSAAVTAEAPTIWFSRSKTRAPRFSIPLVERRRLLSVLDSALDKPLSCLVAPAGFGKSTLLAQWRETLIDRDIPCAWINLDESDREIRQFYAYLTFAFEEAGVSLGQLKKVAENGFLDMSSAAIVTSLLTAIAELDDHMVLILDDYHRAACEEIDDFVKTLCDQFGDKIHIAIGSRTAVDVNLPTLLVAGQAVEIPPSDLRFSDSEVKKAIGAPIDQKVLDELQAQLEGWPVAVQMTRLLGDTDRMDVGKRAKLVGSHGHIADYLVTNVLRNQPEELQTFLLETSILRSFNVALADAVCGHGKSQSLIRQLATLQALVIPLDDDLEWFRYHHLFSECLCDLLKHENPERFAELHRRAAKWCSEHRMIAEAVEYANSIADYELSRQIINDNCEWMQAIMFGGTGYLRGLLSGIPEEEALKDTRILYMKAYFYMSTADLRKALHYNNLAETLIEREGINPKTLRDQLGVGTTLLGGRIEFKPEREGGWLNERLKLAEEFAKDRPDERYLCSAIRNVLACQSVRYGEFDAAWNHALLAEADLSRSITRITTVYTQISFGLVELWTNQLEEARHRFKKAADIAIEFGGEQSDVKFICEVLQTAVIYWQSGLDKDAALQFQSVLMRTIDANGWYDVYSIGFDAIVHDVLCHNDFDKADDLIEKLDESTNRLAIERLIQFAQILRLECTAARNDLAAAEQLFDAVQNWFDVGEKELDDLGWFQRIAAGYASARYLAAAGQYEDALTLVENGLAEADQLDVVLMRVRGNVLKASLLERAQRQDEALETLVHAIEDAARINCSRPFARDITHDLVREAANRVVSEGQDVIAKDFARKLSSPYSKELFTVREKEVLQSLANGKSNKEIARDLDLTDNAIKFHVRNIYRKLDVTKRVNAVGKARELGIIK